MQNQSSSKPTRQTDLTAIAISVVLHGALLLLMSVTTIAAQQVTPIGYIEVDFGPIAEGRPVQATQEAPDDDATEEPEPVVEEQEEQQVSAPEESKPVDLPDEVQADDAEITESDETTISPETQTNPEETNDPDPQPEIRAQSQTGGGTDGGESGAETGDDGAGTEPEASAPFQIEGLNRTPVTAPPPPYTEKVNATIKVRITVDPQGRIVRQIPLLKGNQSLEQAVLETLRNWRFNPLPPNAPQENQVGVVTFRFKLE